MSRALTTELLTQLRSQAVKYAVFLEMFFDSGTVRLHNAVGTVNTTEAGGSARDWLGTGDLGSIGALRENSNLQSQEIEFQLSGLDSTIINEAMTNACSGRVVKMFLGAFDENDRSTGNLSFLWRGRMDKMRAAFGETCTISLLCESEASTLLRTRHAYFSNDLQQRRYPGDRSFQYLSQLPFMKVQWAGKLVTTVNNYSGTPSSRPPTGPIYLPIRP